MFYVLLTLFCCEFPFLTFLITVLYRGGSIRAELKPYFLTVIFCVISI